MRRNPWRPDIAGIVFVGGYFLGAILASGGVLLERPRLFEAASILFIGLPFFVAAWILPAVAWDIRDRGRRRKLTQDGSDDSEN